MLIILNILIAFTIQFIANPTYANVNKPGTYVQIVRQDYDQADNETYATIEVYDIAGDGMAPHMDWMEPVPFEGQPSTQDMLQSISHDNRLNNGVHIIGLN